MDIRWRFLEVELACTVSMRLALLPLALLPKLTVRDDHLSRVFVYPLPGYFINSSPGREPCCQINDNDG